MTAIAGTVSWDDRPTDVAACLRMLVAQANLGPHNRDCRALGPATFGRGLFRTVPEDRFDMQPLVGTSGRLLFTATVRLDNRADVATKLAIAKKNLHELCDAQLLLAAWEKWQLLSLEHVLGDYSFAVWDKGELYLIRGPLSTKPIYFVLEKSFAAFASTVHALHSLQIPRRFNYLAGARYVSGLTARGDETFFESVRSLEQGHVARIKNAQLHLTRCWEIARSSRSFRSLGEGVEALQEKFDQAVSARLRRYQGHVASHLSGGRDSSAVTATAAMILSSRGERLKAFTAAPGANFDEPNFVNAALDESAIACRTARQHLNIDHWVCRTGPDTPFIGVELAHQVNPYPIGHLSNFPWGRQILDAAAREGATVVLSGDAGNFALSAGGETHVLDLLRDCGPLKAWSTMRGLRQRKALSAQTLLNLVISPFMSKSVYAAVRQISGRPPFCSPLGFVREPYRSLIAEEYREVTCDRRSPRSFFDLRREMLYAQDPSSQYPLAIWGIDFRDPTADRDLIDFCFSVPVTMLVAANSDRPLFEAAFGDRLPAEALRPRFRGIQASDWHRSFTKERVKEEFSARAGNQIVRELLDVEQIAKLIENWPVAGFENREISLYYRNDVLGAVSLANFIDVNF